MSEINDGFSDGIKIRGGCSTEEVRVAIRRRDDRIAELEEEVRRLEGVLETMPAASLAASEMERLMPGTFRAMVQRIADPIIEDIVRERDELQERLEQARRGLVALYTPAGTAWSWQLCVRNDADGTGVSGWVTSSSSQIEGLADLVEALDVSGVEIHRLWS